MTTPREYRQMADNVEWLTAEVPWCEDVAQALRAAAEQAEQLAFLMSPQSGVMEKARAIVAAESLEQEPPSSSDPLAGREPVTHQRCPDGGGEPTPESKWRGDVGHGGVYWTPESQGGLSGTHYDYECVEPAPQDTRTVAEIRQAVEEEREQYDFPVPYSWAEAAAHESGFHIALDKLSARLGLEET